MRAVEIAPCGEGAVRVLFPGNDPEEQWSCVHRVAERFASVPLEGVYGAVPTYDSILVEFDPVVHAFATVEPLVRLVAEAALEGRGPASTGHPVRAPRAFTLPVVYGGEHGPDLGFVAEHLGLDEQSVIDLHTAGTYVVRCLGGPAGSCMTDGPAFSAPIPRLPDPRLEVPPNAVSVAGAQGVVGPVRSPSGWRLIGLSPVQVMDRDTEELVPYRPGDVIRFRAIAADEWDALADTRLWQLAEPLRDPTPAETAA